MGEKVFISYRREDASGDARSIYSRLRSTFGKDRLFIDVDTIQRGQDFREAVDRNLESCGVLLAVIGPKWLSARDGSGGLRLSISDDFVRLEIARALMKNVVVIPVLVGNAVLPKPEELPEDLRGIVFRQAALVRHESFARDMDALEEDIRRIIGGGLRWTPYLAAGLAALGLALSILAYTTGMLRQQPGAPPAATGSAATKTVAVPRSGSLLSRIRLRQSVLIRVSENDWQWIEKDPRDNREVIFHFRQQSVSPSELLLYDRSRDMYARMSLDERRAYWRIGQQGAWSWNYDILGVE